MIGSHKTTVTVKTNAQGSTNLVVTYHATDVVTVTADQIRLDTGGWCTATTKKRMNQAAQQLDLGYHVYQRDYVWYCDHNGATYEFTGDVLVLSREG